MRAASVSAKRVLLLVLVCFFLSGFAALVYETVWTRQFAIVFGTSELAVATVLAAYMGGLAAGAAAIGRWADAIRRPLWVYGILELGIAVSALAVPVAIRGATTLLVVLFGGRTTPPEGELWLALFYLVASFAILLVPTALMGATLPLLARFTVHAESDIGSRVGLLYATNTVGAVVGTLTAAFVLLPSFGLRATVLTAAAVNALVFALVMLLGRGSGSSARAHDASRGAVAVGPFLALPLILASGAASFTYEVLWTRLLGHVLGGSTYAFATMLASFLTGIALGGAVASRLAVTPAAAARGFAIAQLGIALLAWLAYSALDVLPVLADRVGAGGGGAFASNAAVAMLILLPAAVAIGATFPLTVRILALDDRQAGAATARVYAWNTAGAILGAVASGFFLIPLLGYAGIATAAIGLNLVLALVAAIALGRARALALAAMVGLGALVLIPPATPWTLVGTSPLPPRRTAAEPIYFAVGRSATVAVTDEGGVWRMRSNGLPEGVIVPAGQNPMSVLERWLGTLPCLARPGLRSMLFVGLGGGSALEALASTVERVDVIELEPKIVEVNRLFSARRAVDPLGDPRIRLYINDARAALRLSATRYDAIVSQPSHPWTAGASHLYTREFFALVRDHLSPDGVFVQWIELDLIDEALLRSLAATLQAVFPQVRMYRPVARSGVVFLASDAPLPVESQVAAVVASSPGPLRWAGVQTPEDVAAALALDESGVRQLATGGAVTTDDLNLLEARSPRILGSPLGMAGADELLAPLDPLPRLSHQLHGLYLVRRLIADQDVRRAVRVGSDMDGVERVIAAGLTTVAAGSTRDAAAMFRNALRRDPDSGEARIALVRLERPKVIADTPQAHELTVPLVDPAAAVIEGWRHEAAGDWRSVRALEGRMADADPYDPIYPDVLLLRARWRIETGAADDAREAVHLLDRMIRLSQDPTVARDLRQRAAGLFFTVPRSAARASP